MAIHFKSSEPQKLLRAFKKAIDEGHVVTWSYDKDGDFTHTAEQWKFAAWLRPLIKSDRLTLILIKPTNKVISTEVYAIYHGRFIESMLVHCDALFTDAVATAYPSAGDTVK
jgi:hypothetical protein